MKGWLPDTNVIAALAAANGAPSVKAWASAQSEDRLWLSVLTLGEYDSGLANLPPVIDTLLVASAIEHNLCLVTRNVRDVAGTGAGVFCPWG